MFCSHCGKEISDDSIVCGFCGTPIDMKRQENSNQQTSQHCPGSFSTPEEYHREGHGHCRNCVQLYCSADGAFGDNSRCSFTYIFGAQDCLLNEGCE